MSAVWLALCLGTIKLGFFIFYLRRVSAMEVAKYSPNTSSEPPCGAFQEGSPAIGRVLIVRALHRTGDGERLVEVLRVPRLQAVTEHEVQA